MPQVRGSGACVSEFLLLVSVVADNVGLPSLVSTGAGRMGDSTQYTVNNQMVNATLMNIADSPTNVQLPGQ